MKYTKTDEQHKFLNKLMLEYVFTEMWLLQTERDVIEHCHATGKYTPLDRVILNDIRAKWIEYNKLIKSYTT